MFAHETAVFKKTLYPLADNQNSCLFWFLFNEFVEID